MKHIIETDPRAKAEYDVWVMAQSIAAVADAMRDDSIRHLYIAQFKSILPAHHDLTSVVEECWRETPAREGTMEAAE